jgi:hypothetical protein
MEEWKFRSTYSWPRNRMEVSGQLHATVALLPGTEPPVSIEYKADTFI